MARDDDDFGRDNGLVHEAVVTGRKVRAGRDFWATLADSPMLFGDVREFVYLALVKGVRVTLDPAAKFQQDTWWRGMNLLREHGKEERGKADFRLVKALDPAVEFREWSHGVSLTEDEIVKQASARGGLYGHSYILPLLQWLNGRTINRPPAFLRCLNILLPGSVIITMAGTGPEGIPLIKFGSQYGESCRWYCTTHSGGRNVTHDDYFIVKV